MAETITEWSLTRQDVCYTGVKCSFYARYKCNHFNQTQLVETAMGDSRFNHFRFFCNHRGGFGQHGLS